MKKYYKTFDSFWNDLEKEFLKYMDKNFIFRGQSDINWKLHSTFYREYNLSSSLHLSETLFSLIQNFEQSLKEINKNINFKNILDFMQYARHYSLPVPLIDFSYSPYIALFFAVNENIETDSVVYIIDYKLLFREYKKFIFKLYQQKKINEYITYSGTILEIEEVKDLIEYNLELIDENYFLKSQSFLDFLKDLILYIYKKGLIEFKHLLINKASTYETFDKVYKKIIEEINPINTNLKIINSFEILKSENELFFIPYANEKNYRMIKQKGCFIYDTLKYSDILGEEFLDLEDFIINKLNPDIIKKIKIPHKFKKEILKKLYYMNINGTSLFGDEYGAIIDSKNKLLLKININSINTDFKIDSEMIEIKSSHTLKFLIKILKDFSET